MVATAAADVFLLKHGLARLLRILLVPCATTFFYLILLKVASDFFEYDQYAFVSVSYALTVIAMLLVVYLWWNLHAIYPHIYALVQRELHFPNAKTWSWCQLLRRVSVVLLSVVILLSYFTLLFITSNIYFFLVVFLLADILSRTPSSPLSLR